MGYAVKLQRGYTHNLFGFRIAKNVSNPANRVEYLNECVNRNYQPAYMNFTADTFNWGSWENAWFMPKPCMLKSNGTVDYYLNPNNYALKASGGSSDIANASYDGNAMMEFPTIWFNRSEDANYEYCYIAKTQVNSNFYAYAHHDMSGTVKDHCYVAIYEGSYSNNKLRSLSGQTCMVYQTVSTGTSRATANGTGWYTGTYVDRQMINDLLILVGKSTDCQTVFGMGNCATSAPINTGTMNNKGLFYGKNVGSSGGVKVFGIENYWGNIWTYIAGKIRYNSTGNIYVKMTWGTEDGSTTTGYNTTGNGYIKSGASVMGGSGYLKNTIYSVYGRNEKTISGGSYNTYFCDDIYATTASTEVSSFVSYVGGRWSSANLAGPFALTTDNQASDLREYYGHTLSYK